MARRLIVWLGDTEVGVLAQVDGRLQFSYDAGYLAQPMAVALSQSLPLRAEPFDDRATRPFFAGLLPEGQPRKLAAQALQASRQNDYALLAGLGGECAGAVVMLEGAQAHAAASDLAPSAAVRWLEPAALVAVLDRLPQRPMLAGEAGLRLSLAGAQDKLPVVVAGAAKDRRIGMPLDGAPSSHILKPAIPGFEGSVANEAFCMTLAGALGMSVAPVAIHQAADDRPVLLVQRYDRTPAAHPGGLPSRLHQEDFCQAIGVVPEHKYQAEGGPDLAQCFALLRRATRPSALQVLRLLDAVIVNALIGNHDAHGKNFSLLYTAQGPQLAPLYDLLCTAVYPQLADKMAMKIGGEYRFSRLHARHWTQFAQDAGLSPAQVRKRVADIARRLPALARQTAERERPDAKAPHAVVAQIVTLIGQRCELTLQRLSGAADAADPVEDSA